LILTSSLSHSFCLRLNPAPCPLPSFPTRRSSDLADVIHHGERQQKDAQLDGYPRPKQCEGSYREGDVRRHGNTPAMSSIGSVSEDRKSTRLNSSHRTISYAVFCLKKKKPKNTTKY